MFNTPFIIGIMEKKIIFILMIIFKEKLGPYDQNMARLDFAVGGTSSIKEG